MFFIKVEEAGPFYFWASLFLIPFINISYAASCVAQSYSRDGEARQVLP